METIVPQADVEDSTSKVASPANVPYGSVSDDELKRRLDDHREWVESEGKCGQRAEFHHVDLSGRILAGLNLRNAQFQGSSLRGTHLQHSDLQSANFGNADLRDARLAYADLAETYAGQALFAGADLESVSLHASILTNADLRETEGLVSAKLGGADLTAAKLPPEIGTFDAVSAAGDISERAAKTLVTLLLVCLYAALAIVTTSDLLLLTNSTASPLPIIQTKIPIVSFYIVVPTAVLCMYLYFHLYLQRLWPVLASLPAVFPDGRPLHEKVAPWLLNGLVRSHFKHLKHTDTNISRLENRLSLLLAWGVPVLALLLFWGRYLPRHDWIGSSLHCALVACGVTAGVASYRITVDTLRSSAPSSLASNTGRELLTSSTFIAGYTTGAMLLVATLGAIHGQSSVSVHAPRGWVASANYIAHALDAVGIRTFADLRNADVSIRPASPADQSTTLVKGARLTGANLARADMRGAFLVKASVEYAQLEGVRMDRANAREANFFQADLTGATLRGTDLKDANLHGANLSSADLWDATLVGADLGDATLLGAKIGDADLTGANLAGADLTNAEIAGDSTLDGAHFDGAVLHGTRLATSMKGVSGLAQSQLDDACAEDGFSDLPRGLTIRACNERRDTAK